MIEKHQQLSEDFQTRLYTLEEQFQQELEQKDLQLAELRRQVEHVKQDRERQVDAVSRELDLARERIVHLQRSESLVEVYKKKVENFEDLRQ